MVELEEKIKLNDEYNTDTKENITAAGQSYKENKEENKELIQNYMSKYLAFIMGISILCLIIQILMKYNITPENLELFFKKAFWVGIPCAVVFLFIVIYAYVYKHELIKSQSNFGIILFPFFLLTYFSLIIVLSLKLLKVVLAFYIMISVVLCMFFIFNLIPRFYNRNLTKLAIVYSYCFLHLVGYIIFVQKHLVEFFILLVFSFLFFAYLNSELRKLFDEYINENESNVANQVPFEVFITAFLIMPVDIIIAPFK